MFRLLITACIIYFNINCYLQQNTDIELKGEFQVCSGFSSNEIIDISDEDINCKNENDPLRDAFKIHHQTAMSNKDTYFNSYSSMVFNKNHEEIYGSGYECEQEKIIYKFYKPWVFGPENTTLEKFSYPLSMDECWKIVKEKRCIGHSKGENKPMKCVNEACVYDDQPKVEYSRGFTIEKSVFNASRNPN